MVYILFSGECSDHIFEKADRDFFKIGFTLSDPEARVMDLQTGNPEPLHVEWKSFGDRETERLIKECFSNFRVRGEWFQWCFKCYKRVDVINYLSLKIDKKYELEEEKISKFNEYIEIITTAINMMECDDNRYNEYLNGKDIDRCFNLE